MSTTGWWILGYALAGVVVLIAATLLIAIILFARRIVAQTAAITRALDGAMRNTNPLFDLANLNHALGSITRGLEKLRGEPTGVVDERNPLSKLRSRLRGAEP
jgi:hypothetical protein